MLLYQNKNKSVIAMTFMNLTDQIFTESQVKIVWVHLMQILKWANPMVLEIIVALPFEQRVK